MKAIHQFLDALRYGDAVGNQALWIKGLLRKWGYDSEIYVNAWDREVEGECHFYQEYRAHTPSETGIIYHHCIGSDVTTYVRGLSEKKMLIYHNITPAHFFTPYSPTIARLCEEGRQDLASLSPFFSLAVGVSHYNARELETAGFVRTGVLPLPVPSYNQGKIPVREWREEPFHLLSVGRLAPNKKQDDLLRLFHIYYRLNPHSQLTLVGAFDATDPYLQRLLALRKELELEGCVKLAGRVSQEELAAWYRSAHVFLSMSEHEGFGVPLVEAMHFGLPVLTYKAAAVPETLGGAGILFCEKRFAEIAELIELIRTDHSLRHRLVEKQRERAQDFLPEKVVPRLHSLLEEWERC